MAAVVPPMVPLLRRRFLRNPHFLMWRRRLGGLYTPNGVTRSGLSWLFGVRYTGAEYVGIGALRDSGASRSEIHWLMA